MNLLMFCLSKYCYNLSALACFQAVDKDAGVNAKISYSISSDVAERLSIDRDTGAIHLSKMIRLGERLQFTVTATDGGPDPRLVVYLHQHILGLL